jgi:hypothetical protein
MAPPNFCSSCGASLTPTDRFCDSCGHKGLKPTPLLSNLGPKPTPPPPTPVPKSSSWDGTYTTAASTMHCSGTATGPDGKQLNTSNDYPLAGTFTVRGNVIQSQTPTPINAGGQASLVVPVTGASGSATEVVLFVHDANGGVHFSGSITANVTVTSAGVVAKLACSGPLSGTRN